MAGTSTDAIWDGLENLVLDVGADHHFSDQGGLPNNLHRRYTSNISSTPQLPDRIVTQYPLSDHRVMAESRSQSYPSSESQQVSIGDLEGQIEEQNLKSLETSAKSFWETHGAKASRQQYREPNTKFGGNQNKIGSGGRQNNETHNSRVVPANKITGWKEFAAGNGGAGARGLGRGSGRDGGRGAREDARATRSSGYDTAFPPLGGKQQGPSKAAYHGGTPLGGWERYKGNRIVQSEQTYKGESSLSFQRGVY